MDAPRIPLAIHTAREPADLPPARYMFPTGAQMAGDGLVAVGADFAPETIVAAYRAGCFPWPHPEQERLWFSPDPRAILPVGGLHVSRRLARTIRGRGFRATVDAAFLDVIKGCASGRPEGTWITAGMRAAYTQLHELGWAHSVEAWTAEGELAGGLYGLRVEGLFGAESMFTRVRDGSKVAMVAMMQWAEATSVTLIDIQVLTEHTEWMGGVEVSRTEYLRRVAEAVS